MQEHVRQTVGSAEQLEKDFISQLEDIISHHKFLLMSTTSVHRASRAFTPYNHSLDLYSGTTQAVQTIILYPT